MRENFKYTLEILILLFQAVHRKNSHDGYYRTRAGIPTHSYSPSPIAKPTTNNTIAIIVRYDNHVTLACRTKNIVIAMRAMTIANIPPSSRGRLPAFSTSTT